MKTILKKLTSLMVAFVMIFAMAPTAMAGIDVSVEDAYEECASLYPEFVENVKAQGVTDAQIIAFLETMQDYLLGLDTEVNEDNFEEYMIEAVNVAISKRAHIKVRDALIAAYPGAVVDGMDGIINPEFDPLVETIKSILFGKGDDVEEPEEDTTKELIVPTLPTREEVEPTVAPTEEETQKPTEEETEAPTEEETQKPTQAPTEEETEPPTEEKTEKPTEKETEKDFGNGAGNGNFDDTEDETEEDKPKPTEPVEKPTGKEPVAGGQLSFKDMGSAAWAEEAVKALVGMKIISGYPDGTFLPNKAITRAEFAKIIVLASGRYDKNAKCSFKDVPESQWYYSYVASAYECGFIKGRSADVFDPSSNITRADICTIVYRFITSVNSEFKPTKNVLFADANSIPAYAKDAVKALAGSGIINGVGNNKFDPLANATRAQSAKIVYGAINAALGM